MKTATKEIFLFTLPIAIVVLFPLMVFFISGEFYSLEKIQSRMLEGEPILYGKAYMVDSDRDFKIPMMQRITPDIMTLGNSRVLTFRREFFEEGTRFFNGGSLVGNFSDLEKVINLVPKDSRPKVVIIGLDLHLFHPINDDLYKGDVKMANINTKRSLLISGLRNSYRDLLLGKYSVFKILNAGGDGAVSPVGLKAVINNDGFRSDGSYYYGYIMSDPQNPENEDHEFKDTFARMKKGDQLFYQGKEISELTISALVDFLDFAMENKIHVIGFHPPYAPTIYDALAARKNDFEYMFRVNEILAPIFQGYGFSLFDYSDIRFLGSSDEEFVDGFHGGEKAYARIIMDMAEKDNLLNQYVDIDALRKKLDVSKTALEIFPN
ncbi:MAG: hypothetical protein A3G52_03485 [Candidatus Taylorbacteria bacterium RIFCSPLOWO2_12_FULL_43_20]|uniref:Uncharacterized protein n=1 Tax=Candidatus Taylorbacteria bacterium RIFCSPLOWO2_12_FULL_43_20 TaxID=1802332 RepID=A0A1G2P2S0_9BACT|nr:MAG: hypothetical protein A2825_02430 [Candidatus Taylorbacteria bacterium RIFCSPHIGHO2_01_FULL_43_120]OHA22410.1 MAG: hypothetical protein A3B98_02330 [Candidatus Taylorbacteria bacterium RIFCSPHIGHO2_02_FULL_43_55]OHA28349.1 MAG: hypothetical protein A3E92_00500 [Candidatus Taylorbacteria bacterium RIFCSPHIGHO2_12_FULL_42_34]OHA30623.1 MAG: hypothetical protein A3B09_00380 [Candidatus Taylorbacteria bacterium RIFCSPLOWO2_01_FULL_43_83]OHA38520.1 MAG: hypothetical protein A3H58_03025 [Candi